MLSFLWNTDVHSILSGVGSRQCIENGVTGDSIVEVGMGQLTGRGNRRPAVIRDVTSRRRKSISIGSMCSIPIQLVSLLTNVRQEKCFVCNMWNKIKNSHWGASVVSLSELAWSLNDCFDDLQFNLCIFDIVGLLSHYAICCLCRVSVILLHLVTILHTSMTLKWTKEKHIPSQAFA